MTWLEDKCEDIDTPQCPERYDIPRSIRLHVHACITYAQFDALIRTSTGVVFVTGI